MSKKRNNKDKRISTETINMESIESKLEQYHLSDTDELMEYLWLRPHHTGLNVDIFVDDGGSYKRHNHVPLLFVRNGYSNDCSQFIPFAITEKPIILDNEIDYGITYNDLFAVQNFIIANNTALIRLANSSLSHNEFIQSIRISF